MNMTVENLPFPIETEEGRYRLPKLEEGMRVVAVGYVALSVCNLLTIFECRI